MADPFGEAHRMSATVFGKDQEDFGLFMSLLYADRFEGRGPASWRSAT